MNEWPDDWAHWYFPVPPVPTAHWSRSDWIEYAKPYNPARYARYEEQIQGKQST